MGGPSNTKLHTEYLVHTLFDESGELMLSLGTDSVAKRSVIFMVNAHRTVVMGRRRSAEGHPTVASRHVKLIQYFRSTPNRVVFSCSRRTLFAVDSAYTP